MQVLFKCKECGIQLSNPLVGPVEDKDKIYEDEQDHISFGHFGEVEEDFRIKLKGEFIINLKDKINVKYSDDPKRKNGCCGYDGCDGMNTVCINGHEVGTECSDCWMPHGLVLHRDMVVIIQVKD